MRCEGLLGPWVKSPQLSLFHLRSCRTDPSFNQTEANPPQRSVQLSAGGAANVFSIEEISAEFHELTQDEMDVLQGQRRHNRLT